jgi:hypothetical protein
MMTGSAFQYRQAGDMDDAVHQSTAVDLQRAVACRTGCSRGVSLDVSAAARLASRGHRPAGVVTRPHMKYGPDYYVIPESPQNRLCTQPDDACGKMAIVPPANIYRVGMVCSRDDAAHPYVEGQKFDFGACDRVWPHVEADQHPVSMNEYHYRVDEAVAWGEEYQPDPTLVHQNVAPYLIGEVPTFVEQTLLRYAWAYLLENFDLVRWIVCCKLKSLQTDDTDPLATARDLHDNDISFVRIVEDTEEHPLHAVEWVGYSDAHRKGWEDLKKILDPVQFGSYEYNGRPTKIYLRMGEFNGNVGATTERYYRVTVFNRNCPLTGNAFKEWARLWALYGLSYGETLPNGRPVSAGFADQIAGMMPQCMMVDLASTLFHELLHQVFSDSDDPTGAVPPYPGCYWVYQATNAMLWAMSLRYPNPRGLDCCAVPYFNGATTERTNYRLWNSPELALVAPC